MWIGLKIAPCWDGSIFELIIQMDEIFAEPWHIQWSFSSLKAVLFCLFLYVMGIGIWLSTRRNYRKALTTALAALGPGGMLGGLATLGILGLMSEAITKYGFDAIYKGVIKELYKKGESIDSIKAKIDAYPISKEMKIKLKNQIDEISANEEK